MTTDLTASEQTLSLNLKRLLGVRFLALVAEVWVLAIAAVVLEMQFPLLWLAGLLVMQALLIVAGLWRVRQRWAVTPSEWMLQLCLDVLLLLALLAATGGAANPFVYILLLPLLMAAAQLPKPQVVAVAALVVVGYSILLLGYQTASDSQTLHQHGDPFDWHVLGMWFGFVFCVAVVVLFVMRMADSLRQREQHLAQVREQALRDEQLIALGTLAAGAAHELGTPLSTMAVLCQELQHSYQGDDELEDSLEILSQQLQRCKQSLNHLSVAAGQLRAESGQVVALDAFLQQVVSDWHSRWPGLTLDYQLQGEHFPGILSEQSLAQALINFLDNAARSSPQHVSLHVCRQHHQTWQIDIKDRGPGISRQLQQQLGKLPVSSSIDGRGLGILLACAVIQRLGSDVDIRPRKGGGTWVKITLELDKLQVEA